MKYLLLSLYCFASQGEEKFNKYDRLLHTICMDLYDNDNNIIIKTTIGDGVFIVADPITGDNSVGFNDALTEHSKRFKHDYTPEQQLEIMEAYEWPIFPLGDTTYIFDKTGMFKKDLITIKKTNYAKKIFLINHSKPEAHKKSLILDTLIAREYHTFFGFKTTSAPNSLYYFRISKKEFNDTATIVNLHKGIMNKNE